MSERGKNGWISTKEQLPAFHRYVLIRFKPASHGNCVAVAYRDGCELGWEWAWPNPYSTFTFDDELSVTHWRPV